MREDGSARSSWKAPPCGGMMTMGRCLEASLHPVCRGGCARWMGRCRMNAPAGPGCAGVATRTHRHLHIRSGHAAIAMGRSVNNDRTFGERRGIERKERCATTRRRLLAWYPRQIHIRRGSEAHARRDHRQRLRGAGRGHPAQAARARTTSSSSSARRGRRDVARQQLPGLRLRRAVAPLLLLLRAQPRLDAAASRRSPKSGTTSSAAPRLRRAPARPLQPRGARRRVGRSAREPSGASRPRGAATAPTCS
jgi:hypothetical protein